MSTRIVINPAAVAKLGLLCADESANRAASITARRARRATWAAQRVKTGALARSYTSRKMTMAHYKVYSPLFYADYQEWGVGPFGPKTKPRLVFVPKGGSAVVFAKHVKGFPAGGMLHTALGQLNVGDFLDRRGARHS